MFISVAVLVLALSVRSEPVARFSAPIVDAQLSVAAIKVPVASFTRVYGSRLAGPSIPVHVGSLFSPGMPEWVSSCSALKGEADRSSIIASLGNVPVEVRITSVSKELVSITPGDVELSIDEIAAPSGPNVFCETGQKRQAIAPESWGVTWLHVQNPPRAMSSALEIVGRGRGNGDDRVLEPGESVVLLIIVQAPPASGAPSRLMPRFYYERAAIDGSDIAVRFSLKVHMTARDFQSEQAVEADLGDVWLSGSGVRGWLPYVTCPDGEGLVAFPGGRLGGKCPNM